MTHAFCENCIPNGWVILFTRHTSASLLRLENADPDVRGDQQMNDALGGQLEILSINAGETSLQHIRAGTLRSLVVVAPARLDHFTTVPTLAEIGCPAANLSWLLGVFAPAGLPTKLALSCTAEIDKAFNRQNFVPS